MQASSSSSALVNFSPTFITSCLSDQTRTNTQVYLGEIHKIKEFFLGGGGGGGRGRVLTIHFGSSRLEDLAKSRVPLCTNASCEIFPWCDGDILNTTKVKGIHMDEYPEEHRGANKDII